MNTVRRYLISGTVALVACLPLVYRFFPNLPLGLEVVVAILIGTGAFTVDHFRNVRPRLMLEDKRTYLFGTVCRTALQELK